MAEYFYDIGRQYLPVRDKLLLPADYYRSVKAECKEGLLLMREGYAYTLIDNDAHEALPIIEELLTHKDAGPMFCWMPDQYAYPRLEFGQHNLDKVCNALSSHGYKVTVCDYDKAFKETGGWEEIDRIMTEYEARQKQEQERLQKLKPVQLSLFDDEDFV